MDEDQVRIIVETGIDILQVGTRKSLNYSLLKQIVKRTAGTGIVVLLKRSRHMAPIDEFIAAGEYIVSGGNPNVVLCPRGTMPNIDGYRNHPDECITPLLKEKTWAPVVVDPSHAVGPIPSTSPRAVWPLLPMVRTAEHRNTYQSTKRYR